MTGDAGLTGLRSLAPGFDEEQHGVYLRLLLRAIDEPGIRNIALTGAYGTGKSSVLAELPGQKVLTDRVLPISLSDVQGTGDTAVIGPDGAADYGPGAVTRTNRIEKEIVKQILYRDAPARSRGSRFRRISRFHPVQEIWIAAGVGILLFGLLYSTGLSGWFLSSESGGAGVLGLIARTVVLAAAVGAAVYVVRWATHGRMFVEKVGAGPATVSLAGAESSFFDEYLDEIVYYFERSGRDVVVFEDLDRFEDVHIFEELRALNLLLNGSEQVRHRSPPGRWRVWGRGIRPDVKFVYALRDSVFEGLDGARGKDAAWDEVRRANRTKFFDMVIPMVPFITHRNARDLMSREMAGTGVSNTLVSLAAGHVADMRLIRDLRNEYDVYSAKLLGGPRQVPGIDADRLFSLLLYKSVHMSDFEDIRLGKSHLDDLHKAWRAIVDGSLADARERERMAEAALEREGFAAARAEKLGDRLQQVARALIPDQYDALPVYIEFDDTVYPLDRLRSPDTWAELIESRPQLKIGVQGRGRAAEFSFSSVEDLMGQALDAADWVRSDRQDSLRRRAAAQTDASLLRHHSWHDLYGRPEFKAEPKSGAGESFADAVARILESRLARDLVAGGYLNEYFSLYISEHYGEHLQENALAYTIHAIDAGHPDVNYPLSDDDIEAIIADKGTAIFRDRAAYNIDVLDHLLATHPTEAEDMVGQLARGDAADRNFMDQYFQAGTEKVKFVRLLAPRLPNVLNYLTVEAPVVHDAAPALVDAALANLADEVDYTGLEALPEYVADNYRDFPSLTEPGTPRSVSLSRPRSIDSLSRLGIHIPDTRPLNPAARRRVADLGVYDVTASNLRDLTGQHSLALEVIRETSRTVYETVIERLGDYVTAARSERAATVEDPGRFVEVLHDIDAHGTGPGPATGEAVRLASQRCRIDSLVDAPRWAWPALAATTRTLPSAANLLAYLDEFGSIDENAARLLEGAPTDSEGPAGEPARPDADGDLARLAAAIVNSQAAGTPERRVATARSFAPGVTIDAASIDSEPGDLVGLLVASGLLADTAATFTSPLMTDWPTKEFAMAQSQGIAGFLSPEILRAQELRQFFPSGRIPRALKDIVLDDIATYVGTAEPVDIRAAARYSASRDAGLQPATIEFLQDRGAEDPEMIRAIANSPKLPIEAVRSALRNMSRPYPLIADHGTSRPTVPDDAHHIAVLDRLKTAGIVKNHWPEPGKHRRRVTLKQRG